MDDLRATRYGLRNPRPLPEHPALAEIAGRILAKTREDGDCLIYQGANNGSGYGRVLIDGHLTYTHRIVYAAVHGDPGPLTIDHICRRRTCVRLSHLRAITNRENILFGTSAAARNAVKTHCPVGHEYNEDNTGRASNGGRYCKPCNRARVKRNEERERAAVSS